MIEVEVFRLVWDESQNSPIVLLRAKAEDANILPIWIGHAEAQAIALGLSGKQFERPLTHDLLRMVIEALGAELMRIEINRLEQNTYHARLLLTKDHEVIAIDARPSDSIAMAVRFDAPIYIAESIQMFSLDELMGENAEPPDSEAAEAEQAERLRRLLEKTKPEDFGSTE